MAQNPIKPTPLGDADAFMREIDEDMQQEWLLRIWQKYQRVIIGAVAAIVIGTAGWTSWDTHHRQNLMEATAALARIDVTQDGQWEKNAGELEALSKDRPGTAQAVMALLRAADLRLAHGQKEAALKLYAQVAADPSAPVEFRQLADLSWARAQLDDGDAATLKAKLESLVATNQPWRFSAMESLALLTFRTGDKAQAKALLQKIKDDTTAPQVVRGRAGDLLRAVTE